MASAFNGLRNERIELKNEVDQLLSIQTDKRTPEQVSRLEAIAARIPVIDKELDLAAKALDTEHLAGRGGVEFTTMAVGKDRAEDQPVSFGEFLQGVAYMAMPGMQGAIPTHVRAALQAGPTGASVGTSADGGFLVRNEWTTALLSKARESSQLLGKCDNIPVGAGADGIEAPYVNETSRATGSRWGGVQVYRRAEADTVTASKPGIGLFELRLEDMMGIFYATERLLRDATALQAIAENAFASEFAFRIDDEIIRGTGAGQCLGILGAGVLVTQDKEVGQANDTVKAENIIKMHARMRPRNMGGAEWYINQEVLPQLMTMSIAVGTAGGQLVYMPPGGLSSAPYGTLLGRRVNVLEQCSALGDLGDVILADFSEYAVISKAMESADSMHVRFLYNERTFRWVYPIIGKPKMRSAITPYKGANTVSPFVTLQAR